MFKNIIIIVLVVIALAISVDAVVVNNVRSTDTDNGTSKELNRSTSNYASDTETYPSGTGTLDNAYYQDDVNDGLDEGFRQPEAVPEPGTLILLGLGLAGAGISRRFRKKQA